MKGRYSILIALGLFALSFANAPTTSAYASLPDLTRQPNDWSRITSCSRLKSLDIPGYLVASTVATKLGENLNALYSYSGTSAPLVLYAQSDTQSLQRQVNAEVATLNSRLDNDQQRLQQQLDATRDRVSDLPYALAAYEREKAVILASIASYRAGLTTVNDPVNAVISAAQNLSANSALGAELRRIERDHRQEITSLLAQLSDRCAVGHNQLGIADREARDPNFPATFQASLRQLTSNYYSQIGNAFTNVYGTPLVTIKNVRAQKITDLSNAFRNEAQAAITRLNADVKRAIAADTPTERAFCAKSNLDALAGQVAERIGAQTTTLTAQVSSVVDVTEARREVQASGSANQVSALRSQLVSAVATARSTYASNSLMPAALATYQTSGTTAISTYEFELNGAMSTRTSEENTVFAAVRSSNSAVIAAHKANLDSIVAKAKTDCVYSGAEKLSRVNPNASKSYKDAVSTEVRRYTADLRSRNTSLATSSKITTAQRKFDSSARTAQSKVKESLTTARNVFRAAIKK